MGILDDAIRQHLELKRQHGADEGEVKNLEDEAFGPATRPGEPDFPGSEADPEAQPPPPTEAPGAEEVAEPPVAEFAAAETPAESELSPTPEVEPSREPTPEPPPEPTPGPEAEPASEAFTTAEREAIAEQPTEFFDQAQAEGGGLDVGELDLDLDDEIASVEQTVDEPLTGEEPVPVKAAPAAEEPLAEPASEALDPDELEPEPVEEPAAPAQEGEPVESEGEDVLEETPEFLQDSPEDDELWFEQGEPKDFDF